MAKEDEVVAFRQPMSLSARLLMLAGVIAVLATLLLLAKSMWERGQRAKAQEQEELVARSGPAPKGALASGGEHATPDQAATQTKLEIFLAEGEKAFEEGKFMVASEFFRRACDDTSTSKDAWLALVRACCRMDDYDEAWRSCEQGLAAVNEEDEDALRVASVKVAWSCGKVAVVLDQIERLLPRHPDDTELRILAANALLVQERADDALEHARKAVEMAPGNREAQLALACALVETGGSQEALGILGDYLATVPDSVRGRLALARAQRLLGQADKAKDTLASVANQAKDEDYELREVPLAGEEGLPPGATVGEAILQARGEMEQAELLVREGKTAAALAAYRRLAEDHPNLNSVQFRLAQLTLMSGDRDGARKLAEKQLAREPSDPGAHTILALIYLKGKLPSLAIGECRKALAKPGTTKAKLLARRTLAIALNRDGDTEGAVEHMGLYLEKRPNDVDALVRQSSFLTKSGNPEAAGKLLRAAQQRLPKSALLHAKLAVVEAHMGKDEAAVSSLRRALELGDRRASTRLSLAEMLIRTGQFEEAAERAGKLRKALPQQALVADTLALCLIHQRKLEEARPHIEFAVKSAPKAPRFRYHHALLLQEQGLTKEAVAELRQALDSPREWPERTEAEELVAKLSARM